MNVMVGIASRQGPKDNPLIKRCIDSVQTRRPGVGMMLQAEIGDKFTRGEKRQRIFEIAKHAGIRYCVILEDDTEILEDDWLIRLVQTMVFGDVLGMMNPLESRDGVVANAPHLRQHILEVAQCFGFCILYDLAWGPRYDPKVTWLDDLAMSLQCRAAGYRTIMAGVTLVRHSKEPFLSDSLPSWDQPDRARWGADSSYYDSERFAQERKAEAHYLIEQFGDMARMSLPPELL